MKIKFNLILNAFHHTIKE